MIGGKARHVVGYMRDFLFDPKQARTPVRALSGGERGRLMLARGLARPSNLLVLDEPTNDLDVETLDVLQEMLADYPGAVLLISHDRDFLDRTVSAVIAPEGNGRWWNTRVAIPTCWRSAAPICAIPRSRRQPRRPLGRPPQAEW